MKKPLEWSDITNIIFLSLMFLLSIPLVIVSIIGFKELTDSPSVLFDKPAQDYYIISRGGNYVELTSQNCDSTELALLDLIYSVINEGE